MQHIASYDEFDLKKKRDHSSSQAGGVERLGSHAKKSSYLVGSYVGFMG